MAIKVKTKISKPSKKAVNVSGVDMEALRTALDRQTAWGEYKPNAALAAKYDKSKKVTEITVSLRPQKTQLKWKEYSRSTKTRQSEWNRMAKALDTYLDRLHNLATEAVANLAKEVKDQDLDKAGFTALIKTAKDKIGKAVDDYASKQNKGAKLGVTLADIPPDPAEVTTSISKPKLVTYSVSGSGIQQVLDNLNKREFWGRYRSNASMSASFQLDGHVKTLKLTAKPVITMPKWKNYSKGNKGQKGSWDTMWKKLKAHEDNHYKLFLESAAKFAAGLGEENVKKADLPTYWTDKNKEWQATQDEYDSPAKSDHGKNEGVILDTSHDP